MAKKKMAENTKAVEARDRKAAAKDTQKASQAKQDEDAYWQGAGEGSKTKAQQKKDEQAAKAAETAAKKAEAKRLAAEEEAELATSAKKKATKTPPSQKVTAHQLQAERERQAKLDDAAAVEKAAAARRMISEDNYGQVVEVENVNRQDDAVEARSVAAAIEALSVADVGEAELDRHPERRMKAAFAAYSEAEMARLRQDKPGMKLSQYKDLVWKSWQKSPQNPLNQAAAASPVSAGRGSAKKA